MPLGTDPPPAAPALGHHLEWDPPAALTAVRRWTCTIPACGATLLDNRGHLYGDATDTTCSEARAGAPAYGI